VSVPVIRLCLWTTLAVLLTTPGFAAGPKVTATVEPAEIAPGGFALYVITVENGTADAASPLVLPAAVELAHPLPSTGRPRSGDRFQYASSITWQITSDIPGDHVIPAQEIHINGLPFKINATTLLVKEDPDANDKDLEPLMTLEAAKRQIYVGEVIPITVNLYAHRQTFVRRIGLIELPKDNFAIQRFPTQANESIITIGKVPYRAYAFHSTLSALKPGKFKLGPASAEVILDIPSATGEPFMHPFLSQMEPRKVRPPCNEIGIEVLALPEAGRPQGFRGVVGDFEISMSASPLVVNVGDPISVDMTITGNGNFDTLTVPELLEADAWKLYPAKRYSMESPDNISAPLEERQLGFNQVIIPQKALNTIPSYEFSYFSPTQKKYITLRTKPVAIKVRAAPGATAAGAASSAQTGGGASEGSETPAELTKLAPVQPVITDILTVLPEQAQWLAARPVLWRNQNFIRANGLALGGLAALILGKLFFNYWQERRAATDAPTRKIWQQMRSPTLPRERLYALAFQYIQAKNLSGPALQPILENHEKLAYAPAREEAGQAQAPAPPEEKAAVLAALKSTPSAQD
jgi:hypothetical protein